MYGVGYHHAGMDMADRKNIESMFVRGELPVLCESLEYDITNIQLISESSFLVILSFKCNEFSYLDLKLNSVLTLISILT